MMEEKIADSEKELSEAKTRASEAKKEFREQKKHADDLSKNIVHSAKKLKASRHLTSMHQKVGSCTRKRPKRFRTLKQRSPSGRRIFKSKSRT